MSGALENAVRLRAALRNLTLDADALRVHQAAALHDVVEAAVLAEPYRSRYPEPPWRRHELQDLSRLPVLGRGEFMDLDLVDRVATRPDRLIQGGTSGTTGEPLHTGRSPAEAALQDTLLARHRVAAGIPARASVLAVRLSRLKEPARIVIGGRVEEIEVPASASRVAAMIEERGPDVIVGEPSTLIEAGRVLERFPLRAVITFGELSLPEMRREIEEIYEATPSDLYSIQEAGHVAWQCRESNYHLNADWVIVEIVDEDGHPAGLGEPGDIVITNLWNRTTPFIRYRTEDRGRLLAGACPCGVSLPLMAHPEGRTMDWILGPDGREHSPFRFAPGTLLGGDFFQAVRAYHLVQREADEFLVELEWKGTARPDLIARIAPTIEHVLGAPVRVDVVQPALPAAAAPTKFRMVESRVSRSFRS